MLAAPIGNSEDQHNKERSHTVPTKTEVPTDTQPGDLDTLDVPGNLKPFYQQVDERELIQLFTAEQKGFTSLVHLGSGVRQTQPRTPEQIRLELHRRNLAYAQRDHDMAKANEAAHKASGCLVCGQLGNRLHPVSIAGRPRAQGYTDVARSTDANIQVCVDCVDLLETRIRERRTAEMREKLDSVIDKFSLLETP